MAFEVANMEVLALRVAGTERARLIWSDRENPQFNYEKHHSLGWSQSVDPPLIGDPVISILL